MTAAEIVTAHTHNVDRLKVLFLACCDTVTLLDNLCGDGKCIPFPRATLKNFLARLSCRFDWCLALSHLATGFGTTPTRLCALLTMFHAVRFAFLGAPIANVRTQLTDLLGEGTVSCDGIGAQSTDGRTFNAAGRAVTGAFLTDHMGETVAAFGCTVIASRDAGLGS